MKNKIWLSSPHMCGEEINYVNEAFDTNWIAPLGPNVNEFEKGLAGYCGVKEAAALVSGTSAIHLALIMLGVKPGDEVICQSFTFSGSANPIKYVGATPVFIDSELDSWNMDPELLEKAIKERIKIGKKPKVIIFVHLYGMPAKVEEIEVISKKYGVPLIEDAAEALGSRYQVKIKNSKLKSEKGREHPGGILKNKSIPRDEGEVSSLPAEAGGQNEEKDASTPLSMTNEFIIQNAKSEWRKCGSFSDYSVLSFNGNKIITTSGGGALLSNNTDIIKKARYLSTQARDEAPHYQHSEVGYNYRMSNVVAGIGRGQMKVLDNRVKQRREIFNWYKVIFENIEGVEFQPEIEGSYSNRWLTAITIDPNKSNGITRDDLRLALEEDNIEARPLWKPMHMQPVFKGSPFYGNGVSEKLFENGLCLPSGTNMSENDRERIEKVVRRVFKR